MPSDELPIQVGTVSCLAKNGDGPKFIGSPRFAEGKKRTTAATTKVARSDTTSLKAFAGSKALFLVSVVRIASRSALLDLTGSTASEKQRGKS